MKRSEVTAAEFAKAGQIYCNARADGKGVEDALKLTSRSNKKGLKLSHTQADWAWYADERSGNQFVPLGGLTLPAIPGKDEPGYEVALLRRGLVVAELRKGTHPMCAYNGAQRELSMGQIAVLCNTPEGAVKRAFQQATGISLSGTRKGRGGRFLDKNPLLYLGNRKGIGTEHANPRSVDPNTLKRDNDTVKSVLPKKIEDLRKQVGTGVARKATKARATKKAPRKAS